MRFVPEKVDWRQDGRATIERNWQKLEEIDRQQKEKGKLLYRYIDHSYADGAAIYQIVEIKGNKARIVVVTGIGDDWILPAWGREAVIPLDQARRFVAMRDSLAELFGKKG